MMLHYALATFCLLCSLLFGAVAQANNGLFGSMEFRADSIQAIHKWRDVLDKIDNEQPLYSLCDIDFSRCNQQAMAEWRRFIQRNKGLEGMARIRAVNTFVNEWPYRSDLEVWGKSDYWATPGEFLQFSGDCEDYVILKYITLLELGVQDDAMRLVVVRDTIRNIAHAVLSVEEENETHVLDSLLQDVIPHGQIKHYIPQYSVNQTTRWAHIMPQQFESTSRQAEN